MLCASESLVCFPVILGQGKREREGERESRDWFLTRIWLGTAESELLQLWFLYENFSNWFCAPIMGHRSLFVKCYHVSLFHMYRTLDESTSSLEFHAFLVLSFHFSSSELCQWSALSSTELAELIGTIFLLISSFFFHLQLRFSLPLLYNARLYRLINDSSLHYQRRTLFKANIKGP